LRCFLILFIVIIANCTKAQNVSFKEIKTGIANSLYDAEMIGVDTLLAVGKNGQIIIFNNNNIYTETKGSNNFYKVLNGFNITQLASDSGCFYFLNKNFHSDAYGKNSIYTGLWFKNEMHFASVNKKIAAGRKALPNGSLTSVHLKNTKHFKGSVIWDLQDINDTLTALKYNIFGTRILKYLNNKWTKQKHYKYLLHSVGNGNDGTYYAGTNNFKRKNAIIITPTKKYIFKNEGVIWDIKIIENFVIASGSNGLIYYKNSEEKDFTKLQLPTTMHLYDITIKNKKTFYVVGQNGVIFELEIK
jgi:hypothetical protein